MNQPLSLLQFDAETGHIWLDQQRMLLLHTRALGALRKELFDSLGALRTRGLLVRMGFASGLRDGELSVKHRREGMDTHAAFMLGPELHAAEGAVQVERVQLEIDLEKGHFLGEFIWRNSWEDEAHVADFGIGDEPACWSQIGYASGYTSAFMGRLVVFKEVECRGQGDTRCRIVGQPAEVWEDEAYVALFKSRPIGPELAAFDVSLEQIQRLQPRRQYDQRLVGRSPAFHAAFDLLASAAPCPITVLLLGETGVGKEMFARWLHEHGPRAAGPFIAVNCAAIPHDLIEAELFGVERGAYTGAHLARSGRFERAAGGTLFLDEVGDLPLQAQVKLLRALQTGEVERLGSEKPIKVDARIVAATNVDLPRAMQEGRFRADLFYRLNAFPITIPPLRERAADIPLLVERFLAKYGELYGKKLRGLTDRALREVLSAPWHGNIRELENAIERAVLLAPDGGQVEVLHLFPGPRAQAPASTRNVDAHGRVAEPGVPDVLSAVCEQALAHGIGLDAMETRLTQLAMQRANGNLSQAARLLGITRPQLAYRLKKNEPATAERAASQTAPG